MLLAKITFRLAWCETRYGAPVAEARKRPRGEVEKLPSGALRVKVYAGEDPLTGRRHFLRETVPPGPGAAREAERVRARLLNQADEGRNPRTAATVNQLMDRYLEVLEVDATTRTSYEGYIRNHVRPLLGKLRLSKLSGETLDSFYSILRTCRATARGGGSSSTGSRARTRATRGAGRTCAGRWRTRRSGSSTSASAAR